MASFNINMELNSHTYANEDEMKAQRMSVQIKAPKINSNIRDKSCIVTFPRDTSENKLTRAVVETVMKREWGELFNNVRSYGNIDFSRRWIFHFDTEKNNEEAVQKEIFINGSRVKTEHATRKFNMLKIDWVPLWTNLEDLAQIFKGINGVSGQFVDIRWGRGDKISKDSTQAILRFYKDPEQEFNPPQYIHFYDDYGARVFLHLTVMGYSSIKRCMRCNQEGHVISECKYIFCRKCHKLVEKKDHFLLHQAPQKEKSQSPVRNETPPRSTDIVTSPKPTRKETIFSSNLMNESKDSSDSEGEEKSKKSWSQVVNVNSSMTKGNSFLGKTPSFFSSSIQSGQYQSKQVYLGRGGKIKDKTPPKTPLTTTKNKSAPLSSYEEFKNQILFSTPTDDRLLFNKIPPKISPLSDNEKEWPPLHEEDEASANFKTGTTLPLNIPQDKVNNEKEEEGDEIADNEKKRKRNDLSKESTSISSETSETSLNLLANETVEIDFSEKESNIISENKTDSKNFFNGSDYF